ncbi:MAG: type 4a pilus biogenesis protein PilO [Endomicrobiia bacterium]
MKKEHQNLIAIGIVAVFLIFLYFRFLLIPLNKKIVETEKKIIEKSQELKKAKILAESLPFLQQETQFLQVEIEELEKRVPKETNIPELLKIISKESQDYNIKILRIDKQNIISLAKEFDEVPFKLNFKCSYHNLGQFLTNLAQQRRIFATSNLKLRYEATTTSSTDDYINGECIVIAYTLK